MSRRRRRNSVFNQTEDTDPLSVVVNLFDVAMVMNMNMTEVFTKENFTVVKNPGKDNMEIITKEGNKINKYTPSEDKSNNSQKKGKKVGVAYELENGEIIYVPE